MLKKRAILLAAAYVAMIVAGPSLGMVMANSSYQNLGSIAVSGLMLGGGLMFVLTGLGIFATTGRTRLFMTGLCLCCLAMTIQGFRMV